MRCSGVQQKRMRMPGFEPGMSPPQGEVLTTILHAPGEAGYRSQYLSHAKRALYHLSYIPIQSATTSNTHKIAHYAAHNNQHDPQTRMHATRIPHHTAAYFHSLTITSRTKTEQVAHNDTTLTHTTPHGIKPDALTVCSSYLRVDWTSRIFLLSASDILVEAQ